MNNELMEIEEQTALVAFSQENGLNPFIQQVRNEVLSFEHNLSNAAQRSKTASLAAKVRKVKTRLDKLGKGLTDEWAKSKKAVDANRKAMRDEMDEIANLARQPLDEWEAEQKAIEAEKAWLLMVDDAIKINAEFDEYHANKKLMDHMQGIIDNSEFDKQRAELAEKARLQAEQEEKDRLDREEKLKREAGESAKLKADQAAKEEKDRLEKEKNDAIELADKQRKAAIQADIDLENEREQNRIKAENAKVESKRLADLAEKNRLAAIEQTKIDEAKKASDAKKAEDEAEATRKANIEYTTGIKTSMKLSLIEHAGLSEQDAIATVRALWLGKINNTSVKL